MASKKWSEVRRKGTPEQEAENRRWVEAQLIELNLRAVRELLGKTQKDIAELAEMNQSDISELERRDDHLVSTLRRYVEALGGEIEIPTLDGYAEITDGRFEYGPLTHQFSQINGRVTLNERTIRVEELRSKFAGGDVRGLAVAEHYLRPRLLDGDGRLARRWGGWRRGGGERLSPHRRLQRRWR